MVRRFRPKRGAILLLCLALLGFVITLFAFSIHVVQLLIERHRYQQAVESAALQASSDLSKIVINDPYFGFISLSDYPAIGKATIAIDGEPLPVHGINTIIATSRLDYIIAKQVDDQYLEELALVDIRHAKEAAVRLDNVLENSLTEKFNDKEHAPHDMDGNMVCPYVDALNAYEESLEHFFSSWTRRF